MQLRFTTLAAAAIARNVADGAADMSDPTMILFAGGSLSSAYASVSHRASIVVDLDAVPASGVQETVRPAKKLVA